jgi:hypothetical protein
LLSCGDIAGDRWAFGTGVIGDDSGAGCARPFALRGGFAFVSFGLIL